MFHCLRKTVGMGGENSQGWITEEAFFTVSPGARQVRQRKEVKMTQSSPAERHQFLKSMEVEWQAQHKDQAAKVQSLEETAQAQARWPDRAVDTRWARTWKPDDSKPSGRRTKARLIIKGFTDADLLAKRITFPDTNPVRFYNSPAIRLQPWTQVAVWGCTAGHSTLETRSSGKRPLFVRIPPDGVPRKSRGVWVQLLKTVNGLADGTREWRNCFLPAARGLGFETSVLEPCVLVLRSTQQKYHGIIGVAVDNIAGGGGEVWEQAISKLKQRFTFGHWEVVKGKFCSREVVQAADGSMRVRGACLHPESGPCASRETEKRALWRCQSERKSCHEIGAWSSWVPST